MKRILMYSHDTFGLGNIRRMLTIAQHLVDNDADLSVLIVSGSPMLHAFRIPPRVDYLKLPCLARTTQGKYKTKYLDLSYQQTLTLRSNLLVSAVLDFDPALIIVDKKPFGVGNELAPTLDLLGRRGKRPKMVLLLRDILDAPAATASVWRKNSYYDAIADYYDQVLVVGSADIFDLGKEYRFPAVVRERLTYCGYLRREHSSAPRAQVRAKLGVNAERLVLATVGGGEDGYRILASYLEGVRADPLDADVVSLLVCGPEMAPGQRQLVREQAAAMRNVRVIEFADDMMGLMDAADLVIAMGGYNTVCELLTLKKRALLVPRVRPVQEQWLRAQRLAELGLASALHPDELTPASLRERVGQELGLANVRPSRMYQINLGGLEAVRAAVGGLLSARPVRVTAERVASSAT